MKLIFISSAEFMTIFIQSDAYKQMLYCGSEKSLLRETFRMFQPARRQRWHCASARVAFDHLSLATHSGFCKANFVKMTLLFYQLSRDKEELRNEKASEISLAKKFRQMKRCGGVFDFARLCLVQPPVRELSINCHQLQSRLYFLNTGLESY